MVDQEKFNALFVKFIKNVMTEKLKGCNLDSNCMVCFSNSLKNNRVRKYKCCNSYICIDCAQIYYKQMLPVCKCIVCRKKYQVPDSTMSFIIEFKFRPLPEMFWFSEDPGPALPVVAVPRRMYEPD
jgi:hypothetical protein